jgi:C4-dicarboxylate-specific signal transduction histidine kinase
VFQSRIKNTNIELILPESEDYFDLFARSTACSQVFANLLDNAIYWLNTPSWQNRDKAIRISSDSTARTIVIEDTGPGIHSPVLEGLFQPFVTKKSDGQGLGLYICDFYLGQMKAKITYEPKSVDRFTGARFIIDFSKVPEE